MALQKRSYKKSEIENFDVNNIPKEFVDYIMKLDSSIQEALLESRKDIADKLGLVFDNTELTDVIDDVNQDDLDDFSRVNTAAKFIQSALNEFYNNSIYKSEFISEIVIFNPHDIAQETLQQIQQITMLEVNVFGCNIPQKLASLGFDSYEYFKAKGQV